MLVFDQADQTVLPWQTPNPEKADTVLEAAQQDLITTIPGLVALVKTLPSLEILISELAQVTDRVWTDGNAVSDLIKQVQTIVPKTRGLQDRVKFEVERIENSYRQCHEKVKVFQKEASERGPIPEQELEAREEVELDKELDETGRQLYPSIKDARRKYWRSAIIRFESSLQFDELKLQESVEKWAIGELQHTGGLHIRSYAVGQRLVVHQNEGWLEQAVTHSARGSAHHQFESNGGQLSIALHPWNHAPLVLPLASFEALRTRHASTLRTQHASIVDALSGQRLTSLISACQSK